MPWDEIEIRDEYFCTECGASLEGQSRFSPNHKTCICEQCGHRNLIEDCLFSREYGIKYYSVNGGGSIEMPLDETDAPGYSYYEDYDDNDPDDREDLAETLENGLEWYDDSWE